MRRNPNVSIMKGAMPCDLLHCSEVLTMSIWGKTVQTAGSGFHQDRLRASTNLISGLLLARPTPCRNSSVGDTSCAGGRRAYMSAKNLASCVTACTSPTSLSSICRARFACCARSATLAV